MAVAKPVGKILRCEPESFETKMEEGGTRGKSSKLQEIGTANGIF